MNNLGKLMKRRHTWNLWPRQTDSDISRIQQGLRLTVKGLQGLRFWALLEGYLTHNRIRQGIKDLQLEVCKLEVVKYFVLYLIFLIDCKCSTSIHTLFLYLTPWTDCNSCISSYALPYISPLELTVTHVLIVILCHISHPFNWL